MTVTREKKFVLLLACLAVLHVFIFSAAYPFFNNVDEPEHLDLAVRYAHADIPRHLDPPDEEALPYLATFSTLEYTRPPESQPGGVFPPPIWKQPMDSVQPELLSHEDTYRKKFRNSEASQPPLYYALAGAWWHIGKAIALYDAGLLYWMRFLNLPIIFGLVWLAWFSAKTTFPENPFVRIAVPAFIAFLPQTSFYSINNDILTPVTFGLVFLLLIHFLSSEQPSPRLAATLGLALAAAYLTKASNLPLLAVTALFLAGKILLLLRRAKFPAPAVGLLLLCAGLPIAAWMWWCQTNFGDLTGSAVKAQYLHWTDKPFAQWWHHPIFTPGGFYFFVSGNLTTFWQGEFTWHGKPLAFPAANQFYIFFSLAVFIIILVTLFRRPPNLSAPQSAALAFGLLCLAALFAFFLLISIKYDFHDCYYPSQDRPYFTSGRLMLGALIPTLILCAVALDRLLSKTSLKFRFLALSLLLTLMLAMEISLTAKIFPNSYNWYHL